MRRSVKLRAVSLISMFALSMYGVGACSSDQEEPEEPVKADGGDEKPTEPPPAEPPPAEPPPPPPPPSPPPSPPPPPPAEPPKAAVDPNAPAMWAFDDDVPVRDAPNDSGKKVRELKYAERVSIVEEIDGWVKIGDAQFVKRAHLTDRKAKWGKKGKGPKKPAKPPKKK